MGPGPGTLVFFMSVAEIDLAPPAPAVARAIVHHVEPPTSPSRVLCAPASRVAAIGVVFLALALAAAIQQGWLLLRLDGPIERYVVANRTSLLDVVFRRISFLGSTVVVLAGGAALAALAWRRCRLVAALVVVATLSRPLVEATLKLIVGRDRPSLDQMVNGAGHSFPSGHVMAAATLWLLVPVVLSLYYPSSRAWWLSTGVAVIAVGLIGASRVYLGVHWASDVVAGTLVAAMLLTALDLGFRWLHRRHHCAGARVAHE
jgi:undecaprenyl-diphosphatase